MNLRLEYAWFSPVVCLVTLVAFALFFLPSKSFEEWNRAEISLGFNPFAVKRTGLGEMVAEVLVRQVDVAWHGGGKPPVHGPVSFCDLLERRYRELTTHPFSATRAERLHNRERAQVIVRTAFYLSPSNLQAYQAYFHLLSMPGMLGEMLRPDNPFAPLDPPKPSEVVATPNPAGVGDEGLLPGSAAYQELKKISFLSLENLDRTEPQQLLAEAWIWHNLYAITAKGDTELRRTYARNMTSALAMADSTLLTGHPLPPNYNYPAQRAFLGKLNADMIK